MKTREYKPQRHSEGRFLIFNYKIFSSLCTICVFAALLSGCTGGVSLGYLLEAGVGELRVLTCSVPIEDALADPNLSADAHDKLQWAIQVREYARQELGLNVKNSYSYYYDTGSDAAVYNLSASPRDALAPLTWNFPIAGTYQYLGYFDLDTAKIYRDQLKSQGYDVVIYGAIAYSTGGIFRDPLYSSLLKQEKSTLTQTIIHELTHNTIYRTNDSEFNESVAEFVGNTGGLQYIKIVAGEDSDLYRQTVFLFHDSALINQFLAGVYNDLSAFYSRTDLTSQEKIDQREIIFQASRDNFTQKYLPQFNDPALGKKWGELPVNNAWVLLNRRYNRDTTNFEKVYQGLNQNMAAAIAVFKQAADAPDAWQFLSDWQPPGQ